MKGIFHIHTHYSFDCMTNPKSIVLKAHKMGIDLVVIADHNTLKGSIAAKKYAESLKLKLDIPIAGEFFTDIGDVIVVGVPENFIAAFSHQELCKSAKEQGGYTVLPHPYDSHKLDKIDYDLIDCIEIYNAKSKKENDEKSKALALRLNKPVVYGADAHFLQDIMNCPFSFSGSFPHASEVTPLDMVKTTSFRKAVSQMTRGVKQKNLKLFLKMGLRAVKSILQTS